MASNISSTSGEFDDVIHDNHPISEQLKVKQWATNQKQQLEVNAASREISIGPSEDIEQLAKSTEILENKLVDVSSVASVKELILQKCQVGQLLLENLFPPLGDGGGDNLDEGQRWLKTPDEDLLKLTEKQSKLSTEILGHQRKITEAKPELDHLKINRKDLMVKSRELVFDIKECQERYKNNQYGSLSDDRIKKSKQKLDDELSKVTVQRNILQSLILGSGINWANDPELKELLLSLGEPLSKLTEDS